VALSRKHEDFSSEECELLNAARPFLIQTFRSVVAFDRLRRQVAPAALPLGDAARETFGLTRREAEVLEGVIAGRSNQDIAQALGLSVRTIQKHLEHAFRKLNVKSRTEAAAMLLTRPAEPAPRPAIST
ncbi:MAG: helix-turn-helix transcriptional regulator, partial [Solirubrobacteraceae bacterium]|nr:helix-turn-helix transcriptional regulator [Solirubrobacteraceae bacterium]